MKKLSWNLVRSAFGPLLSSFTGPKEMLGVDIGSYAVKVAWLQSQGPEFRLRTWGHLPLDSKPEASPEERGKQAVNALRGFLIQKGVQLKHAASSISGNTVIVRYVKLPRRTRAELSTVLAAEAEPFIPFDIKEVQLGFHILGEIIEEGQKMMETVLVAAKREAVQAKVGVLQGAGLKPAIVDVDSFALEGVHERIRDPKEGALTSLYLNIGHMVTNLSIIEGGVSRVVRDIFISGNSFTRAVMKALQCDFEKAEELKKKHGLMLDAAEKERALQEGNRDALGVSQAVAGVVRELVGEVQRSVDFYLSQGPERSVGRIALSGGSALLGNLSQALATELKVPVELLDPLAFVQGGAEVPRELVPSLGVAVGLALRRSRDWA